MAFLVTFAIVMSIYAAGSATRENQIGRNGEQTCPVSKVATFHWLPYGSELFYNNKTKEVKGALQGYISAALNVCCPSLQFEYSKMKVKSSKEVELRIRGDRNVGLSLYFPVFANKYQKEKFQRPFIGLYDSPGPIIFVNDKNKKQGAVFTAMTESWQIPTLCILLAAISGVILWFLDHKSNKEEFPQEFHRGSCVGLWWAFVTMTTVGYGDIVPKSFQGRLFAVIWMIIGTIALTLFNAQLTALITSNEIPSEVNLIGKKIIIPKGGKPFLEEELNLGAEYQEEDFVTIFQMIRKQTDDILMMYNYKEIKLAESFGKATTHKSTIKLIKTIDHRFTIGITASGNITKTDMFLKCIEREMVDLIVARQHYVFNKLAFAMPTKKPIQSREEKEPEYPFETMATLVAIGILGLLVGVGLILEYCGKRETTHGMGGQRLNTDETWYREKDWPTRNV